MISKCPFRKETKEVHQPMPNGAVEVRKTEEFAKCYGNGCPFYNDNFMTFSEPTCTRIEMEVKKIGC